MTEVSLPRIKEMVNPMLQALRNLDGSAHNDAIRQEVATLMDLNPTQLQSTFIRNGTEVLRIDNRLDWVKVYLGTTGYIEKQGDGVWTLTERGIQSDVVDPQEIISRARETHRR